MTPPSTHATCRLIPFLLSLALAMSACVEDPAPQNPPHLTPALEEIAAKGPGGADDPDDAEPWSGPIAIDPDLSERLAGGEQVPNVLARTRAEVSSQQWEVLGVEVVRTFPTLKMVHLKTLGSQDVERMEAAGDIVALHAEHMLEHDGQAAAQHVGQPQALALGFRGQGVGIAILDTGVDFGTPDFGGCTAIGTPAGCKVAESLDIARPDGLRDDDGHGTNVAAIAAQLAPDAHILALDVFGSGGVASSIDVIAGIEWVLTNQALHNIRVVNLSLGGGRYTQACDAGVFAAPIGLLHDQGIHVVTSTGNDGFGDAVGSPACVSKALAIGAAYGFDINGEVDYGVCKDAVGKKGLMACFSNASPSLDLVAPGVGLKGGGSTYTGTSQAAPVASGALALLAGAYPTESVATREGRLLRHPGLVVDARTGSSYRALSLDDAFDVPPCAYEVSVSQEGEWRAGGETRQLAVKTACGWGLEFDRLPWISASAKEGQGGAVVELVGSGNPYGVKREGVVRVVDEEGAVVAQVVLTQEAGAAVVVMSQAVAVRVFFDLPATPITTVPVQVVSGQRGFDIAQMCVSVEPECEQWVPYEEWSWVELPGGDGLKTVHVSVVSKSGERLESPVMAQLRLDTVAPEDGRVSLTSLPGQGVKLSWGAGTDSGGEVVSYKVVWSANDLPKDCSEGAEVEVLYHGSDQQVIHEVAGYGFSQIYYRVCAIDEAFHPSVGVAASYGGPF